METKTDDGEGEDSDQPPQRDRILRRKNIPIPLSMMG
jgi:hypothetical protein